MTGETAEKPSLPGERLRRQRERQGLSLSQAGSELHVDQNLLAALEADDYMALGAPIFVKGHLRNYARLLGLDPVELVAAYEAAQQPADPTLVGHRPDGPRMETHQARAWVGWIGWIFLLLLGLLLAAWWYYQQEGGADFTLPNRSDNVVLPESRPMNPRTPDAVDEEPAVEQPEIATDPLTGSGDAVQAEPQFEAETPAESDELADEPITGDEADADGGEQQQAMEAPPSVAQRPAPAPAPAGSGLVLEFSEESWVEIYDAEGRPILYDLLEPGARREVNASGQLRLFLGNADGVQVYVNGERFNVARHTRSDSTARFTVNVPAAD